MERSFTTGGYADLLRELRDAGYSPRHFANAVHPSTGDLFIRHDVDYCLRAAADMCKVEAGMGVTSTWFVLVRSPLFNPAGAGERELLRSLRDNGGEIGLQFDASYYDTLQINVLENHAREEIDMLEVASGGPVVAISFHKPPELVRNLVSKFAGLPHTSEPRFMRDAIYVSDTLARFAHDPVTRGFEEGLKAMQLLTHPIWWTGNADMDGLGKLDALRAMRDAATHEALIRSVTAYGDRARGQSA